MFSWIIWCLWELPTILIKHAMGHKERARVLREAREWQQENPHIQLWSDTHKSKGGGRTK